MAQVDAYLSKKNKKDGITSSTIIKLYNKNITLDQWFEVDGFVEEFNKFKDSCKDIQNSKKFINEFYSKLSNENKLILEVYE